jgi:hypothetical protein
LQAAALEQQQDISQFHLQHQLAAAAAAAAGSEAMQALAGVVQQVQQRGQEAVWADALADGPASLVEALPAASRQQVGSCTAPACLRAPRVWWVGVAVQQGAWHLLHSSSSGHVQLHCALCSHQGSGYASERLRQR